MKVINTHNDTTSRHYFRVDHEGKDYEVTVYTNESGKFIDEDITLFGEELEHEGTDGQIREDIMDYLDENWDNLIKL
jgi:hypothetical protein